MSLMRDYANRVLEKSFWNVLQESQRNSKLVCALSLIEKIAEHEGCEAIKKVCESALKENHEILSR